MEHSPLIETKWTTVRLKSKGARFINGVSSSYDDQYSPQLEGVISEEELRDIVARLNDTLLSFWPCNVCLIFGFVCSPFTCGASLLCPRICVSEAEKKSLIFLENHKQHV
eukprot:gene13246-17752_t